MSTSGDAPLAPPAPPSNVGPPLTPASAAPYPARLEIAYPERLNRVTTAFRLVLIVPIAILSSVLAGGRTEWVKKSGGNWAATTSAGITTGIFTATALMILFRRRYPRWWFDFELELARFTTRIGAYLALLTDAYPSTVEHQAVTLEIDYPDVEHDLNRWFPLVKWLIVLPHYIVLGFLVIGAFFAVIIAWFAILFTGRYPRSLFDYVVGVGRWGLRVKAYAFLLVTDQYPPFSLR
jgi:hypothetical protein